MSDVAVRVENLGKRFRIGSDAPYHRLSEVVTGLGRAAWNAPRRLLGRRRSASRNETTGNDSNGNGHEKSNEFWALKDVSFDVKEGEVVGIIGRNGAGKSTLLKILSRITEPTTGRFGVKGRVGSLLEVGTGFHPELTGRENVYLSGTILGMTRREVRKHFDEIAAFAEIDDFLDTPVKRYSSGMKVRLGFAVAAHLKPEILIVDEVLAVGDAAFQKKCLRKMGDVAGEGRTVLFVSHNMSAIAKLTDTVVLVERGTCSSPALTDDAIRQYLSRQQKGARRAVSFERLDRRTPIRFLSAALRHARDDTADRSVYVQGDVLDVEVVFEVEDDLAGTNLAMRLNKDGDAILTSFDIDSNPEQFVSRDRGVFAASITLSTDFLKPGCYSIDFGAGEIGCRHFERRECALEFTLEPEVGKLAEHSIWRGASSRPGVIVSNLAWTLRMFTDDRS